ncbi:hypothetical protein NL676_031817 [Syzygium grande]|nr:hypothetical protein NL676_031817 [Syzygium grande]
MITNIDRKITKRGFKLSSPENRRPFTVRCLTKLQAREDDANDGEVRFHVEENYNNEENTSPFKHEGILIKKASTGGWKWTSLLLVNQGLATLAFFGVGVNLLLFLTRVLEQGNASAANNVSKWTETVYLCSLIRAFLSDSYWGRYLTCIVFQLIFVLVSNLLYTMSKAIE